MTTLRTLRQVDLYHGLLSSKNYLKEMRSISKTVTSAIQCTIFYRSQLTNWHLTMEMQEHFLQMVKIV